MPINPATLAAFASEYSKGMTNIRSRRVQRLLKREFAGAEYVLLAQLASGRAAVLGLSPCGAAICATDGKGKQASVVKWAHESTVAVEAQFDLHKDSLPALSTATFSLAALRAQAPLQVPTRSVPPGARPLVSKVLLALA
jgi:hypothetical protein